MMLAGALLGGRSHAPSGAAVLGAAAGAGAAVAAVAAVEEVRDARGQCRRRDEKLEIGIMDRLLREHVKDYCDPDTVLSSLHLTFAGLQSVSPAFPQVKVAFDAILAYQTEKITSCCGFGARRLETHPRMLVCEFMKNWLQKKSEDVYVATAEVQAFRDLCRDVVNHRSNFREHLKYNFVTMFAHVAEQLDCLLQLRLRQRQDCAAYLTKLRKEAYNFVLHALKVLLLAPTSFEVPGQMYSTDSLAWLRETALGQHAQKQGTYQQQIAEQWAEHWATDAGRLVRRVLCSEHGTALCDSMETSHHDQKGKPLSVLVKKARRLPDLSAFDTIDPFVVVKAVWWRKRGKPQVASKAATTVIYNERNPVWNQELELSVPTATSCVSLVVEVVDFHEVSAGLMPGTTFARARSIDAAKAFSRAAAEEVCELTLEPVGDVTTSEALANARVAVQFRLPNFERDAKDMREKWECCDDAFKTESGLLHRSFCEPFLKAAEELDNLIYFLDILFSQCLELAQLLGDLGMVLCGPMIRPLLEEVETRVISVEHSICARLVNAVFEKKVETARVDKGWFAPARPPAREADQLASKSADKLKRLKPQMLANIVSLRHACAAADTATDVLMEAQKTVVELIDRLSQGPTARRTARFGAVAAGQDEGEDNVAQTFAKQLGLLDLPAAGHVRRRKSSTEQSGWSNAPGSSVQFNVSGSIASSSISAVDAASIFTATPRPLDCRVPGATAAGCSTATPPRPTPDALSRRLNQALAVALTDEADASRTTNDESLPAPPSGTVFVGGDGAASGKSSATHDVSLGSASGAPPARAPGVQTCHCGAALPGDASFCRMCGAPVARGAGLLLPAVTAIPTAAPAGGASPPLTRDRLRRHFRRLRHQQSGPKNWAAAGAAARAWEPLRPHDGPSSDIDSEKSSVGGTSESVGSWSPGGQRRARFWRRVRDKMHREPRPRSR